ncbi:hypothetical protein ACFY71_39710 [Streptomyces cinerochromogenes]|uniref:hypothetical protein n=1 Tax=Streptomyces cinerochromogenes TaxID=66422 RepID=UPI0036955A03
MSALLQPRTACPTEPAEEGYALLGQAWRSSTPTPVVTGQRVDLVRVTEAHGRPVLDYLRRRGLRRGAVFTDHGAWHFFVPTESGLPPEMDWPEPVTYLSGQQVTIPPRGARAGDSTPLHWITRKPPGQLLTAPIPLWAALRATVATPPLLAGAARGPLTRTRA